MKKSKRPLHPAKTVVVGYGFLIALGTVLLAMPAPSRPGAPCSLMDSFFTATSAVCVTGLSVRSTSGDFSLLGQFVILLLIQVGGLGYMTLTTFGALLIGRRITLRDRLILRDTLSAFSLNQIGSLAKRVVMVTLILETVGALVLTLSWARDFPWGKSLYFGIFHSISAFNNAGFSLFDGGLAGYPSGAVIHLVVAALFIVGGLGFLVISELHLYAKKEVLRLSLHTRIVLVTSALLLGAGTIVILGLEWRRGGTLGEMGIGDKLLTAFFQAATPRTAGFNTVDIAALLPGTLMVMMVLMLVGASPGGTGGGIKTTTAVALYLSLLAFFRGEKDVTVGRRRLPEESLRQAHFLFMTAVSYIFLAAVLLILVEETNIFAMWFEVVSAFGTVGLSLGDGGALSLSALLSPLGKLIIITTMFMGRVGVMTVGIALVGKEERKPYRYPQESITIG